MELAATTKAQISILKGEMDAIHHANTLYWTRGQTQTLAAKAEYQRRNERLEKIREDLAHLRQS